MRRTASPQGRLVTVVISGTATFVVGAVGAAIAPEQLATPVAVLDVVLFVVGLAAFAAALVRAAARSRHEELSVAGLFLLTGSAPPDTRRVLLGCLAAQTVVAFATAAVRPFTPLAFGVLVPTFGLGACGLWAARHGTFPVKVVPPARGRAGDERPRSPADSGSAGGSAMMEPPQSLPRRRRRR